MALFFVSETLLLPPTSIATPYNVVVSALIVTGLVTKSRFAPRGLRLSADWRTALTTTMRMVAGVHHRATHGWANTHMALTPGFTNALVLVIEIAHLPDGRHAEDMHPALLT